MSAGRKSLLTDEVQERICEAVSLGAPNKMACAVAGISEATFYRWIQKAEQAEREGRSSRYREFRDAVRRAGDSGDLQLLHDLRRASMGACIERRTITHERKDGRTETEVIERYARPDVKAATWLLSHRRPEVFGDTVRLEHTGPDGGALQIEHVARQLRSMDSRQLRALARMDDPEEEDEIEDDEALVIEHPGQPEAGGRPKD